MGKPEFSTQQIRNMVNKFIRLFALRHALCVCVILILFFNLWYNEICQTFILKPLKLPAPVTRKGLSTSRSTSWLRLQEARVDWQTMVVTCRGVTDWGSTKPGWEKEFRTSGDNSYISSMDIRPAGEFTKIFIQTRDKSGKNKTIGGDWWRVHLKGPSNISATVFDHENGTYEAMALVLESGKYVVEATLDYSLCDGVKDPPENWFRIGNKHGEFQHELTIGKLDEYLKQRLQGGKPITIEIPPVPSNDISSSINELLNIGCRKTCKALWNGYGRWIKSNWMPYISDLEHPDRINFTGTRNGTLWLYGDSQALKLWEYFVTQPVCTKIFKTCRYSYNWVYPILNKNKRNQETTSDDDFDFRPNLVLEPIRKILNESIRTADSLLILNFGLHFTMTVNFTTYQNLITDLISIIQNREKELGSKGRVIWKTMTAIHKENIREKILNQHRCRLRFLTGQRVQLYDRYAMSAMCEAGIEILDVYHITASNPKGAPDAVHYLPQTYHKVEKEIQRYWTNGLWDRPGRICIRE